MRVLTDGTHMFRCACGNQLSAVLPPRAAVLPPSEEQPGPGGLGGTSYVSTPVPAGSAPLPTPTTPVVTAACTTCCYTCGGAGGGIPPVYWPIVGGGVPPVGPPLPPPPVGTPEPSSSVQFLIGLAFLLAFFLAQKLFLREKKIAS
jgi:hypothetical protein